MSELLQAGGHILLYFIICAPRRWWPTPWCLPLLGLAGG